MKRKCIVQEEQRSICRVNAAKTGRDLAGLDGAVGKVSSSDSKLDSLCCMQLVRLSNPRLMQQFALLGFTLCQVTHNPVMQVTHSVGHGESAGLCAFPIHTSRGANVPLSLLYSCLSSLHRLPKDSGQILANKSKFYTKQYVIKPMPKLAGAILPGH